MTTNKAAFWFLLLAAVLLSGCKSEPITADFQHLEGKTGQYSDYKGQWLLINYWAEWCAPCIKELPELNELDEKHADIQVLGVHFDHPAVDKQVELVKSLNITFPVILGQPHIFYQFPLPQVLPATVVVNPEGKLVNVLVGPQTQETLLAEINRHRSSAPTTDDKAAH